MEITQEKIIIVLLGALLGGGSSTIGGRFLDNDSQAIEKIGREETAQWSAIKQRMTKDEVKLYILENISCQ